MRRLVSGSLWRAAGTTLLLLGVFFFVKGKFWTVADGGGKKKGAEEQTGIRASGRSAPKATRPSPGTSFVLPEIVEIIRDAAPRDTADKDVQATILAKLNAGIDDGTWPRGKVMASLAKMVDDYPILAFLLMGRLAPGSGGKAYQASMVRTYASRDPDGALALLCRHGPVGSNFDSLSHSVVAALLRRNPSDLMTWLRKNNSHEEELLVRKEALKMLQAYGENSEGLSILDSVLADTELPEDLKLAALRGRLKGTAELGGEEWMKYLGSMGNIGNDAKVASFVIECWPDSKHEELVEFVENLPPGEEKDKARGMFAVEHAESGELEESFRLLEKIESPDIRKSVVQDSTIDLFRRDENAAAGYIENLPMDTDRSAAIDSIFPRLLTNGKTDMAKRIAALEPDPERRRDLFGRIERFGHSRNRKSQ